MGMIVIDVMIDEMTDIAATATIAIVTTVIVMIVIEDIVAAVRVAVHVVTKKNVEIVRHDVVHARVRVLVHVHRLATTPTVMCNNNNNNNNSSSNNSHLKINQYLVNNSHRNPTYRLNICLNLNFNRPKITNSRLFNNKFINTTKRTWSCAT